MLMGSQYVVGVYARISREDGDKAESESLGNQRNLIDNYIKKHDDMVVYKYYNDDNFSGTNFNRPGFQEMFQDIKAGNINCIIVKDLSRFGRDYIDVGNYIQKIFPQYGVRFIAINDQVDSLTRQYDMITPIKNIFNEQYARDISSKIISNFRAKQEMGLFMGAFPSYGYKKDPENKYHLIIDEYPATIVRRIFKMYCDGKGKIAISKILNNDKILCPSDYKKSIGEKYHNANKLNETNYWTYSTIHKILSNQIYTGAMVQHTNNASKFDYSSKVVDKKEWIVVPNTHEAIIDEDTWNLTQDLLKRRTRQVNLNQNVSVFAGFLVCGNCGRSMSKTYYAKNKASYRCGSYVRYAKGVCTSHYIREEQLISIVLKDINAILSKIDNIKKIVDKANLNKQGKQSQNTDNTDNINSLKIQRDKIKFLKKSTYEDYKMGLLTKDEFISYKNDYDTKEENISNLIEQMQTESKSQEEVILESQFVKNLKDKSKITELDRPTLEAFYNKILLYEDSNREHRKIKFQYKFQEIVDTIQQY